MNKLLFVTLQIHGNMSSVSSEDVFLYRVIDTLPKLTLSHDSYSRYKIVDGPDWAKGLYTVEKHSHTNKVYTNIYIEDIRFYNRHHGLVGADKNEMKSHVQTYLDKGWLTELPPMYKTLREVYDKSEEHDELIERIENGYIIPHYYRNMPAEQYRGSITDDIWYDTELQDYVKRGVVFGYIGSSNRTHKSDISLITFLKMKKWTNRMIAEFMSCRNARHFADQLDHGHNSIEFISSIFDEYNPEKEDWFIEATCINVDTVVVVSKPVTLALE